MTPLIPRNESAKVGSISLAYLIRPGSDFRGDRIRCDTGCKRLEAFFFFFFDGCNALLPNQKNVQYIQGMNDCIYSVCIKEIKKERKLEVEQ